MQPRLNAMSMRIADTKTRRCEKMQTCCLWSAIILVLPLLYHRGWYFECMGFVKWLNSWIMKRVDVRSSTLNIQMHELDRELILWNEGLYSPKFVQRLGTGFWCQRTQSLAFGYALKTDSTYHPLCLPGELFVYFSRFQSIKACHTLTNWFIDHRNSALLMAPCRRHSTPSFSHVHLNHMCRLCSCNRQRREFWVAFQMQIRRYVQSTRSEQTLS